MDRNATRSCKSKIRESVHRARPVNAIEKTRLMVEKLKGELILVGSTVSVSFYLCPRGDQIAHNKERRGRRGIAGMQKPPNEVEEEMSGNHKHEENPRRASVPVPTSECSYWRGESSESPFLRQHPKGRRCLVEECR